MTGRPLSSTNSRNAVASVSPVTKTTRAALPRPASLDLPVERAPVEIGHADIGEDHVVVLGGHPLQRLAPGAGGDDPVLRARQDLGQRFANFRLVVDDEDRALARVRLRRRLGVGAGRLDGADGQRDREHARRPSVGQSAVSVPPWASTMPRLTARPTPVPTPVGLVVK